MRNTNVFAASIEELKGGDVFGFGNTKLGSQVQTFSLPAIDTCPGSTALCRKMCYAVRPSSFFVMENVQRRYWDNLALSRRPDFAEIAIRQLQTLKNDLVRWHVSGDIYDAIYASKLYQIIAATPEHKHWFYTRSWRQAAIFQVLRDLAALPQVQMWFSCDRETGRPKRIPPGVRLAYMKVDEADNPSFLVDLIFRENALRKKVEKQIAQVPVCPSENGITHTTCQSCRLCLVDPEDEPNRRTGQRFALPVVA